MQWNQSTMYEQRVRFILEVQQRTFSFAESCRRYRAHRRHGPIGGPPLVQSRSFAPVPTAEPVFLLKRDSLASLVKEVNPEGLDDERPPPERSSRDPFFQNRAGSNREGASRMHPEEQWRDAPTTASRKSSGS